MSVPTSESATVLTACRHSHLHRFLHIQVKASIASVRKVAAAEVSQDPRLAALLAAAADAGDAVDAVMAAATFEALVATLPHDLSLGWAPRLASSQTIQQVHLQCAAVFAAQKSPAARPFRVPGCSSGG